MKATRDLSWPFERPFCKQGCPAQGYASLCFASSFPGRTTATQQKRVKERLNTARKGRDLRFLKSNPAAEEPSRYGGPSGSNALEGMVGSRHIDKDSRDSISQKPTKNTGQKCTISRLRSQCSGEVMSDMGSYCRTTDDAFRSRNDVGDFSRAAGMKETTVGSHNRTQHEDFVRSPTRCSSSLYNARSQLQSDRMFDKEDPDDCWGTSTSHIDSTMTNDSSPFGTRKSNGLRHPAAENVQQDWNGGPMSDTHRSAYDDDPEMMSKTGRSSWDESDDKDWMFGNDEEYESFKRNWYRHSRVYHDQWFFSRSDGTEPLEGEWQQSYAKGSHRVTSAMANPEGASLAVQRALVAAHTTPSSQEQRSSLMREIEDQVKEALVASANNVVVFASALGIDPPNRSSSSSNDASSQESDITREFKPLKAYRKQIFMRFHPDRLVQNSVLEQHLGSCVIKALNQMNQTNT